jgi:hypothetical protein
MKKKTLKTFLTILTIFVLLCPCPIPLIYKNGGTRDYPAILYRVVVWNVLLEDPTPEGEYIHHRTAVYLFPVNFKSIDELWKIEKNRMNP